MVGGDAAVSIATWRNRNLGFANFLVFIYLNCLSRNMTICVILPVSGSGVVWTGLNSALLVPDTPDTLDRMVLGRWIVWTLAEILL